jgi:phosphatidylglycerol:prolipoprotein diacylglycerol transferase
VVTQFDWYLERPKRLLDFRTGHVFYGGYIGSITFPLIYTVLAKVRFRPILDITATYMPLALAIHRSFGCFNAGCCFGRPTDVPWAVTFPAGSLAAEVYGVVPAHPTQLYEAGAGLVMFAFLLYWRKHYYRVAGELFALQVALYAVARFVIEFYRGDVDRGGLGGLSTSQWVSVGMLGLAAIFAAQAVRERRATPVAQPPSAV